MSDNKQLAVFRVKVAFLLLQFGDKMKIFIAENAALGLDVPAIRKMRRDPLSRWAMERETVIKAVKREVAGLVNKIHLTAYTQEL
jgi:hypothetical protein